MRGLGTRWFSNKCPALVWKWERFIFVKQALADGHNTSEVSWWIRSTTLRLILKSTVGYRYQNYTHHRFRKARVIVLLSYARSIISWLFFLERKIIVSEFMTSLTLSQKVCNHLHWHFHMTPIRGVNGLKKSRKRWQNIHQNVLLRLESNACQCLTHLVNGLPLKLTGTSPMK